MSLKPFYLYTIDMKWNDDECYLYSAMSPQPADILFNILGLARRAGSDGSMSASGSAGPGFDPRRGSKF